MLGYYQQLPGTSRICMCLFRTPPLVPTPSLVPPPPCTSVADQIAHSQSMHPANQCIEGTPSFTLVRVQSTVCLQSDSGMRRACRDHQGASRRGSMDRPSRRVSIDRSMRSGSAGSGRSADEAPASTGPETAHVVAPGTDHWCCAHHT